MFEVYRHAFYDSLKVIYWGGETRDRIWDDNTMLLYIFIICVIVFLCSRIEFKKYRKSTKPSDLPSRYSIKILRYPLLFLLFFMGLRGSWVGMDTIVYSLTFENATSIQQVFDESTTEPLYKLLQFVLRSVISNRYLAIFILSSLVIYFLGKAIRKFYWDINILISILSFTCCYYFQSFNLIRITIAATFILSQIYLLFDEKFGKFAVAIMIATLFHYSSIVAFLPFCIYLIYRNHKVLSIFLLGGLCLVIMMASYLLSDYIVLIERYSGYVSSNDNNTKIGMMFLFEYLPCLYLMYYIFSRKISSPWADLTICYSLSGIVIKLLAYSLPIAGRLSFHFMPITVLFIPYWLSYFRHKNKKIYKPFLFLCLFWLTFRVHFYFLGYLAPDGIMPYYFFWNEKMW